MGTVPTSFAADVFASESRAALREKLLGIVGLLPDPRVETATTRATPRDARGTRSCMLFFDPSIGDLEAEKVVARIRICYPQVTLAFFIHDREFKELACHFGSGSSHKQGERETSLERAAAAHWRRIERACDLARARKPINADDLAISSEES